MSDLTAIELTAQDGEPRVDSETIADRAEVQHKNVLELLDRYAVPWSTLRRLP